MSGGDFCTSLGLVFKTPISQERGEHSRPSHAKPTRGAAKGIFAELAPQPCWVAFCDGEGHAVVRQQRCAASSMARSRQTENPALWPESVPSHARLIACGWRRTGDRVTLGVYSHVIGESQRNAVEKIALVLDPSGPQQKCIGKWIQ